jgi:hypothetical protein
MTRRRRSEGFTRIEAEVVVVAGLLLVFVGFPGLRRLRDLAFRASCGRNLSSIGKVMLTYANDYGGAFPRAGGAGSSWGVPVAWNARTREEAFWLEPDDSGGQATIGSCLYLLVRYAQVPPKTFVCKTDAGTTEFRLAEAPGVPNGLTLADAWDFGPNSYRHYSYAYHLPFGPFGLTTSSDPGMPVAADRNPWLASPAEEHRSMASFKPDIAPWRGTREQARLGNSPSHRGEGQNVLFADGRVSFERRSYCGLDQDNIYTVSDSRDRGAPLGARFAPGRVKPANHRDALLVHDPPALSSVVRQAVTLHTAREVNSKSLRQTVVLATLDCSLPARKNAIWCSTFQMAWDRLRSDVIGEPIQVLGAEPLANRLNQAQYTLGDIEEESYYVHAGAV